MSDISDKPAFPVSDATLAYPGMTYRQWLIGQIAHGAYAHWSIQKLSTGMPITHVAEGCVLMADAIILQLEREQLQLDKQQLDRDKAAEREKILAGEA